MFLLTKRVFLTLKMAKSQGSSSKRPIKHNSKLKNVATADSSSGSGSHSGSNGGGQKHLKSTASSYVRKSAAGERTTAPPLKLRTYRKIRYGTAPGGYALKIEHKLRPVEEGGHDDLLSNSSSGNTAATPSWAPHDSAHHPHNRRPARQTSSSKSHKNKK